MTKEKQEQQATTPRITKDEVAVYAKQVLVLVDTFNMPEKQKRAVVRLAQLELYKRKEPKNE